MQIAEPLLRSERPFSPESWNAVNHVLAKVKRSMLLLIAAARGVDVALFLMAANMDLPVMVTALSQSMDQPQVRVKIENVMATTSLLPASPHSL